MVNRATKILEQMKANPRDWRIKPVYVKKFLRLVEEGVAE